MAIAFVQSRVTSNTGASAVLAFNANTAAGNLIIVAVSCISPGAVTGVTDSQGLLYRSIGGTVAAGTVIGSIWYAVGSLAAADTVTVALSSSVGFDLAIHEYSGAASDLVAAQYSKTTGSNATPTSGAITNDSATALYFAYSDSTTGGTSAAGTSYTGRGNVGGSFITEDQIVTTSSSRTATSTYAASTTWFMFLVVFGAVPAATMATIAAEDVMSAHLAGPSGRNWPTPDAAKQFDEMTSWTDFVILPSAASIAQQMEDGQAHDLLGGRNWPVPQPARQLEEMVNWTQRVLLPPSILEDWDSRQRAQAIWWGEDEGDWVSDVFILIPPFDPTQLPQGDQQDIPSPRGMVWAEDDNPLNIFLPPPGWDDGFDFSQLPVMKLEDYREEGVIPIIPSVFDDDFLFSYQPTMKLDDDREYLMRIFIPTLAWDDDWQMAMQPLARLEEIDSPLQLFLPPFDPTQRPAGDDYDFAASRQWMLEEADSPLLIFLPPAPWVEDSVSIQRPYPPACLSVEPEGQWVQLIIVLAQPPPGEIPGRSVFHLRRGVHIFR